MGGSVTLGGGLPRARREWSRDRTGLAVAAVAVGAGAGTLALMRGAVLQDIVLIASWGALLAMLALHDMRHRVIRNRVVYPALGIAIAISPIWSDRGLAEAAAGGAVALVSGCIVLLMARGGMGGGDLKLWLLIGLVVGYPSVWTAGIVTVLAGGMAGAVLVLRHSALSRGTLAYAPCLALGGLVALVGYCRAALRSLLCPGSGPRFPGASGRWAPKATRGGIPAWTS